MARSLVAVVGLCVWSALAGAQEAASRQLPRGTITGEVVDAASSEPLPGATVVLTLASETAILPPQRGTSAFPSIGRSMVTGPSGMYRFEDLPYGDYRLRVQRIGYKPMTLEVRLGAAVDGQPDARLSVGLAVLPVRLEALNVRAATIPSYGRMEAGTELESDLRVTAARLRQQQFLGSDVRELTHTDVSESVTLGETDLFRAFHRLPGVATRDDYSAELWTRGTRWDLTRIYFDGVPLFGPFHAFGLLSGVATDAIGAAMLHPGVRPASLGEGGAGVLDLQSRAGGGSGDVRGLAELSLLSGRLSLDQRRRDGRAAWMVAARRSYLDLLVKSFSGDFPYHFEDVAARVDYQLAPNRTLEASGLLTRDVISRDLPDILHGNRVRFGNGVGRVSLVSPIAGMHARHTIGVSHFGARIDTIPENESLYSASGDLPMRSSVLQISASGDFEPTTSDGAAPALTFGYALTAQRAGFDGDVQQALVDLYPSGRTTRRRSLSFATLWAERRWRPTSWLLFETGLRVDAGSAVANASAVRPMPRLQARVDLGAETSVSVGVGRSYQYVQAINRLERGGTSVIYPSPLWVMADASTPALRSDIATLGAERWLGDVWLASANAYRRRSGGYLLRDPHAGSLLDRALFVTGAEEATGVELGLRKLAGRVTGSLGYTYGVARTSAVGLTFPSAQDRRHSIDWTILARATRSLQLGAAYTRASGAPYTRIREGNPGFDPEPYWIEPPTAEQPNARRAPAYASLDLLLDWSFVVSGNRWATFVQLRNALGRDNVSVYSGYNNCGGMSFCSSEDRFDPGLPRIPVIGFRATF